MSRRRWWAEMEKPPCQSGPPSGPPPVRSRKGPPNTRIRVRAGAAAEAPGMWPRIPKSLRPQGPNRLGTARHHRQPSPDRQRCLNNIFYTPADKRKKTSIIWKTKTYRQQRCPFIIAFIVNSLQFNIKIGLRWNEIYWHLSNIKKKQ